MINHAEEIALSNYIADVYSQAREMDINNFRTFCMNQLKRFVDFDAGVWLTRRQNHILLGGLETFVYNLPDDFMTNYARIIEQGIMQEDPFSRVALEHPNQSHTVLDIYATRDNFRRANAYIHHCGLFGMENVLCNIHIAEADSKVNILGLYQINRYSDFSSTEKLIVSLIQPHLTQAMTVNILSSFDFGLAGSKRGRAVSDIYGNILEADARFARHIGHCGNRPWRRIELPKLRENRPESLSLDTDTQLVATLKDTFVCLEVDAPVLAESLLTAKQKQVCGLLCEGKTDKQIAKEMGISHYTVSNHLKSIYNKLNTTNRVDTIVHLKSF